MKSALSLVQSTLSIRIGSVEYVLTMAWPSADDAE